MPTELELQMAQDAAVPPSEDRLAVIRQLGAELRDKLKEAWDAVQALKALNATINEIKHRRLPDLMSSAGVDHVGLPQQGNLPACDVNLKPYYKANISAEWDEARRVAGFTLVEQRGYADAIKTRIVIEVDRDPVMLGHIKRVLEEVLPETPYSEQPSIQWNTLTKIVREETEAGRPFSPAELDRLGATVGRVAELKERR